jgi:hypothetical protein
MRVLSLLILLPLFAACAAQAAVSGYPAIYHAHGNDYYESLRTAKIAWLTANAASVASDVAADKARLMTQPGGAKTATGAAIERFTNQARQIADELAVMRGRRDKNQEYLLKRNVESWIGAARRGGNGALALRLMYDLQGTGL